MAIKINGTIVADLHTDDESIAFENINNATGTYDNLRAFTPNIGDVGGPANNTLDFNFSSCFDSMTANHTYTEANKSSGRVLLFWLNRNPSGTAYTPTFSANIKWPNDTEPTWADYNNWLICLVCWDSTTVRATASGFGTGTVTETITLSGTTGSYNTTITTRENNPSAAYWKFNSDGTVFRTANDYPDPDVQFNAGTEWCSTTPSQTYYIRCTLMSSSYSSGSGHLGNTFNTWHALTSNRSFGVSDNTAGAPSSSESYKIEIADDSGGSNIVATGYYRASALYIVT